MTAPLIPKINPKDIPTEQLVAIACKHLSKFWEPGQEPVVPEPISTYDFEGVYREVVRRYTALLDSWTTDTQVQAMQAAINGLMHTFDSEEDRSDFVLDIVNEYRRQLEIMTNKTKT